MSALPALSLLEITHRGIDPALRLFPPRMDSPEARVQLLATGLQESQFRDRRQMISIKDKVSGKLLLRPVGPAKSFWMGEVGGGLVHGTRTHPSTAEYATLLYQARHVHPVDREIWNAIEHDDVLAAGLARLLLWSDRPPLPALGDIEEAWKLYADRTWRPGKPRKGTWPAYYLHALRFVTGEYV